MSEIGALRQVAKVAVEQTPYGTAAKVTTATGRSVDVARGFNVVGPDGVKVPFKGAKSPELADQTLKKAKEWTRNFYAPDKEYSVEKLNPTGPHDTGTYYTMERKTGTPGDKFAGSSRISFEDRGDGAYHVVWSATKEADRGKGIGAGLYRQLFAKAKAEGMPVKSDNVMTADSIAVWERFKQLGYPIKKNPTKTMGPGKFAAVDLHGSIYEFDPKGKMAEPPGKHEPLREVPKVPVGGAPEPTTVPAHVENRDVFQALRDVNAKKGIPEEERTYLNQLALDFAESPTPELRDRILTATKRMGGEKK